MRNQLGLITLIAVPLIALGQPNDRVLLNPPRLQPRAEVAQQSTLMKLPRGSPALTSKKELDLAIAYTDSRLFNPTTGRYDNVRLRSYTGPGVDPATPFVAPTLEVRPGESVRVNLHNRLPPEPGCRKGGHDPNTPHCFNSTNLHAHGLWVSPTGNSDNVLLSINPGVSFLYEYNIPAEHPAGTFWYHSHRHGSTALQVSSGMAGALIVRGDRIPTQDANGDIDTLLPASGPSAVVERIMVMQQIQYACLDATGAIKVQKDATTGRVTGWDCEAHDVGGIEFYDDPGGNGLFGPPTWRQSGRYTSINGVVLPTIRGKSGYIERWRLVHGGVRDTIRLEIRKLEKTGASSASLPLTTEECRGEPLPFFVIASDGLTMKAAQRVTQVTLQPGYRNDLLVVYPQPGTYCIINAEVTAAASVSQEVKTPRLIGFAAVSGGRNALDVKKVLVDAMTAMAKTLPQKTRATVIADLKDLKFSRYVPHADIGDGEVTGKQELTFVIRNVNGRTNFEVSNAPYDPKPYEPDRIDRVLRLGGVDEWTLQSRLASHPFHIHINPFQIVKILDPRGRDVSEEGAIDDADGKPDAQYPGLKGVWKDTVWIKSLIPKVSYPDGVYTIVIRTRYQRFIGEFVLHCHILDHEDQGMMQNVRIDIGDGHGGTTHRHH